MAQVTNVRKQGNQLALIHSDGSILLARPTGNQSWLVGIPPLPPPDPTPEPGKGFVWPFDPRPGSQGGQVGSEYGMRNGRMHWGIDFGEGGITANTPIIACASGRVHQNVANHSGWGNYIVIDHGNNLFTLHAHMIRKSGLNVGDLVNQRQLIGNVGNTGASFGNHLHWETYEGGMRQNQAINPRQWMKNRGVG
jgi:murein DD-endopeptidase MepM/ murein hydrolase activator NlpD